MTWTSAVTYSACAGCKNSPDRSFARRSRFTLSVHFGAKPPRGGPLCSQSGFAVNLPAPSFQQPFDKGVAVGNALDPEYVKAVAHQRSRRRGRRSTEGFDRRRTRRPGPLFRISRAGPSRRRISARLRARCRRRSFQDSHLSSAAGHYVARDRVRSRRSETRCTLQRSFSMCAQAFNCSTCRTKVLRLP